MRCAQPVRNLARINAPVTVLASHEILEPMREKAARIERSRGSFGMELYGFDRQIPMPEPFVRSIVEVDHGLLEGAWE